MVVVYIIDGLFCVQVKKLELVLLHLLTLQQ